MQDKRDKRYRRHKRVRSRIIGTNKIPRFCVFRSNKHIHGQLIDDEKGKTILVVSDKEIKKPAATRQKLEHLGGKQAGPPKSGGFGGKLSIAHQVGKLLAERATKMGVTKVVFDRGGYKYHGRVKALAEGAREGGLKF
jgi:large subunit ribosomal protein L18